MNRYEWVTGRKAEGFPITMACEVAGVSRQGFYDWVTKRRLGRQHQRPRRRCWWRRSGLFMTSSTKPTGRRA